MKRDFQQLDAGPFDLLVIGGGIYGAWSAYDAALRGLRVALIEKDDWSAATSSASSKLIHGGVRYLEHVQLGLVRKSLAERRRLLRLAPHRVDPLRFVLPVYRGDRYGRFRLRLGLWLYDRLAGSDPDLPGHRAFGRDAMLERWSHLNPDGLRGGFTYPDCRTDDARFTLEIVAGAIEAGAVAANRVEAVELLAAEGRVDGALIRDLEGGGELELRARCTLLAAGPFSGGLLRRAVPAAVPEMRLTKGVHLVMPALPGDDACLLLSDHDRRVVFLIPWYGRTLVGTTDTDYTGDPARVSADPPDVAYLLAQADRALRGSPWGEADVIGRFAGLRSLPGGGNGSPSAVSRELQMHEPLDGLLLPVGGKYTSARADSADIVDRVARRLGRTEGSTTAERPFPWRPEGDWAAWLAQATAGGLARGLDEEVAVSCARRYGTSVELLFATIDERRELAARIVDDLPFCWGEIVHGARHEMALTLPDLLRRRVPLLLLARPDGEWIARAAELAGLELGWSAARRQAEVEALCGTGRPAIPGR